MYSLDINYKYINNKRKIFIRKYTRIVYYFKLYIIEIEINKIKKIVKSVRFKSVSRNKTNNLYKVST